MLLPSLPAARASTSDKPGAAAEPVLHVGLTVPCHFTGEGWQKEVQPQQRGPFTQPLRPSALPGNQGRCWQGCLLGGNKCPAPWVLCAELGQSIKCPSRVWAVLIKLWRALQ